MGELAESTKSFIANVVGGVTASVATVLTAGAPAIWPFLLPAIGGALGEEVCRRMMVDDVRRAQHFVDAIEQRCDGQAEAVFEAALHQVSTRRLLAQSSAAVLSTDDEWVIDKLATVFVEGVNDPAVVNQLQLIVDVLRQLEALHIRMLRTLVDQSPFLWHVMGTPNSHLDIYVWRREDIASADPQLADAFDPLIGKLQTLGLVNKVIDHRDNTFSYFELTSFGRLCTDDLRRRVERRVG